MSNLTPRIDRFEKNVIINGNFDFWQRGTSSSASGYLSDRFSFINATSTGTHTRTRSTDVPTFIESGYNSVYSDLITVGTPDATLLADERAFYSQVIEGNHFKSLFGKTVTLSFWVKCSKIGTQSVSFNNGFGTGGAGFVSYVATYTINAINTWEKKVITLDITTSGTWGFDTGYGLNIAWSLGTSATNQFATGTVNQWIVAPTPAAKYHFTGNLNLFDTAAATWRIAQIQLIEGAHSDPQFSTAGRAFAEELALCQRYYEKSYGLDIAVPTAGILPGMFLTTSSNSNRLPGAQFAVRKRATPTWQVYSQGGTGGRVTALGGSDAGAGVVASSLVNEVGLNEINFPSGGIAAGSSFYYHWAADAEF